MGGINKKKNKKKTPHFGIILYQISFFFRIRILQKKRKGIRVKGGRPVASTDGNFTLPEITM